MEICHLTRAPLGYVAERAPLGGGGKFCPPCLSSELPVRLQRAIHHSKALKILNLVHIMAFKFEVKGEVKLGSKVKNLIFCDT
jgi:hypothetical protein